MKVCKNCQKYSLEMKCGSCGSQTNAAHPPKYSKEDKYAIYRRKELYPQLFA
ncbi:MAG: nucleolar RNA-binding Nop10p family protein [Candidatus Micrarchaeota archaeon]